MSDRIYPVAYAQKRQSPHWTNHTTTWEEICGWILDPKVSASKESGNYILAELRTTTKTHKPGSPPCTNVHRDNASVVRRAAILVFDADAPEEGFEARIDLQLHDVRHAWHTTWSHTPSEPRFRLLVAVDREMNGAEYCEAAEALADRLGIDFDRGTYEPARYMFLPAHAPGQPYEQHVQDGREMSVDELLDEYSKLAPPTDVAPPKNRKQPPLEMTGTMGAFNRAYTDLNDLIEAYDLPYVLVDEDRWRLAGTTSDAGMGPVKWDPHIWYSNHAHDPAFQQSCSAFDLVRLHRFKELDEHCKPGTPVNRRPSHEAMLNLALDDPRVSAELLNDARDAFADVDTSDDDAPPADPWAVDLDLWQRVRKGQRTGNMVNTPDNWRLIQDRDCIFNRLRLNQMTLAMEFTDGPLPWRTVTREERQVEKADRIRMREYLRLTYRCPEVSREDVNEMIDATARARRYHPVREYLEALPPWDGRPRAATCLPGVKPTAYSRWMIVRCLLAAVARVYRPGIPWDHALVLYGGSGVGKSRWVEAMAKGFDGRLPSRIDTPDARRVITRSWIVVADEGHSLKRAEVEFMKDLLTQKIDTYRIAYDRDPQDYPRMSVVWATTNDATFLRNEIGNRRFLVAECHEKADFDKMAPDYVDQVWAEIMDLYASGEGETLHLSDVEEAQAQAVRDRYTEEDLVVSFVQGYVNRLVPAKWPSMGRDERLEYWRNIVLYGDQGTDRIDRVCSAEIIEAADSRLSPVFADRQAIHRVTNALKGLPGWVPEGYSDDSGGHGRQMMFLRAESLL